MKLISNLLFALLFVVGCDVPAKLYVINKTKHDIIVDLDEFPSGWAGEEVRMDSLRLGKENPTAMFVYGLGGFSKKNHQELNKSLKGVQILKDGKWILISDSTCLSEALPKKRRGVQNSILKLKIEESLLACAKKVNKETTSLETKDGGDKKIFFVQGKNKKVLDGGSIELEAAPFAIEFMLKKYNAENEVFNACRIAAMENQSDLNTVAVGMHLSDTPCFGSGTGMAGYKDGYRELFITSRANHYLFYDGNENDRVKVLRDFGDYAKVSFHVPTLNVENEIVSWQQSGQEALYLSILFDENLNEIIDEGELTNVVVRLK